MLPELPTAILDALLEARYRSKDPAAAVDALCAQHPDFAAAIRAHAAADTPASQPVVLPMAPRGSTSRVTGPPAPTQIGPYRILNTLGEGGMGTVYLAEQSVPVKRKVALKLIKLGMDSKAVVARFEQERQALALMAHDGIAKVYDCGMSERGQPFFVMELVKGIPLNEFCEQNRLSLPDRLLLMRQVCAAVQHAHQKSVVHRDLKPSNVLVSDDSGKPMVKIIDFGLAKAMGQKLVEATFFTQAGQVVGTPEYMAPEQADPTNADIDTRADIYSLGVMLYEVLVGQLPFSGEDLRKAGLAAMQRMLRDVEPQKPSTKLSSSGDRSTTVAGARRMSVGALQRALKNDLDWVVLKAMEKDRSRRYETANALSADLQRFLEHEPLLAGPPSAGYRLKKLVRRYRGQVLAVSAVVVTAVLGAVVAVRYAISADANEQLAMGRANENAKLAASESVAKGEAEHAAELLGAKMREFDLLAGVVKYKRVIANEKELYPAWPSKIAAMETWLREDAGKLLAMQREIERTVQDLRERALPPKAEEAGADRRSQFANYDAQTQRVQSLRHAQSIRDGALLVVPELTPEQQALDAGALNWLALPGEAPKLPLALAAARLALQKAAGSADEYQQLDMLAWALLANGQDAEAKQRSAEALAKAPAKDKDAYVGYQRDLVAAIEGAAANLAKAEAALTTAVSQRRTFRFESESHRFLHDTLAELLVNLSSLDEKEKAAVEKRLFWANHIQKLSLAHPNARHTWEAVRSAIACNPKYAGRSIELREQDVTGLVPIGENPVTRLWEFYELRSAWGGQCDPGMIPIPTHNTDGTINVTDDTGIVFVLLPGGAFRMGAQTGAPNDPNFTQVANSSEVPVHAVTLAPFFLARHEMTRGQWERLAGTRPFQHIDGVGLQGDPFHLGPTHPADSMDWEMANRCMEQHGLLLPTEAQWEYGCRAGTTTPWWPGPEENDLQGCANVHDQKSMKSQPDWGRPAPITDDFTLVAPVGMFRDNAFGLFDVHGNVWEWCLDYYGSYKGPVRAGDGYRLVANPLGHRVYRGGSYDGAASAARSAYRAVNNPSVRYLNLGLRPARALRR